MSPKTKHSLSQLTKAFISERAGVSVLSYLADETLLSKVKLKAIMQVGGIWRKSKLGDPYRVKDFGDQVKLGDEIHLYYDEKILKMPPAKLVCQQDEGSYSLWYKPQNTLKNEHLYCDHLSFVRAIERDLPSDLQITLIFTEHPDVYGQTLFCHTRVKAADFCNATLTGQFRFYTKDIQLFTDAFSDGEINKESAQHAITLTIQLSALEEVIESIMAIQPQDPNHPWLECLSIDLPQGF